ncbi:hypothetical protein GCM10009677_34570 [Sphaerisporangium rubeum]
MIWIETLPEAGEEQVDGGGSAGGLLPSITATSSALTAVTQPRSVVEIPTDVPVDPVTIHAGPPRVFAARTLANLRSAMEGDREAVWRGGSAGHARLTARPEAKRRRGTPGPPGPRTPDGPAPKELRGTSGGETAVWNHRAGYVVMPADTKR